MSIKLKLAKLLIKLGEDIRSQVKFMAEAKLADGTIIMTPSDEWASGVEIFVIAEDGEAMPLPVGTYEVEGGASIIVENEGVIASYTPAEMEEEPEAEDLNKTKNVEQEAAPAPSPKSIIESVSKEMKFEETEAYKNLATKIESIETMLSEIKESVKAESEANKTNFSKTAEFLTEVTNELVELSKPLPETIKNNPEGNSNAKSNVIEFKDVSKMEIGERVKYLREKLKK